MFILSAFADEISPDPQQQIDVLSQCGVKHIELRSIHKTNVLDLTELQVSEFKSLLDRHGFQLSAIGSPIGKIKIDTPFEPHLQRFERALELCKVFNTPNIRVFSYYKPEGTTWDKWRGEVLSRMAEKVRRAEKAGVRLYHENEHNIYGDDPKRVVDLLDNLPGPHFQAVYDAANYVFCGYDPWQGWEMTPRTNRSSAHQGLDRGSAARGAGRRGAGPMAEGAGRRRGTRLRRLCHPGAAPARRRPHRRSHWPGTVPEGGGSLQGDHRQGRGQIPVSRPFWSAAILFESTLGHRGCCATHGYVRQPLRGWETRSCSLPRRGCIE